MPNTHVVLSTKRMRFQCIIYITYVLFNAFFVLFFVTCCFFFRDSLKMTHTILLVQPATKPESRYQGRKKDLLPCCRWDGPHNEYLIWGRADGRRKGRGLFQKCVNKLPNLNVCKTCTCIISLQMMTLLLSAQSMAWPWKRSYGLTNDKIMTSELEKKNNLQLFFGIEGLVLTHIIQIDFRNKDVNFKVDYLSGRTQTTNLSTSAWR